MKKFLKEDPWKIIEDGFHSEHARVGESVFSIGNGKFGLRGNFEESFSGQSLQGQYVAGVYYPDKTRVGWWKNGYPEYFAKVLNAPSWIYFKMWFNDQEIDLNKTEILDFHRSLDMRNGLLLRSYRIRLDDGSVLDVESKRFCSMYRDHLAAMEINVTLISGNGTLKVESALNGKVRNSDSNYEEKFWRAHSSDLSDSNASLCCATRKTNFLVAMACSNQSDKTSFSKGKQSKKFVSNRATLEMSGNDKVSFLKKAVIISSLDHPEDSISKIADELLAEADRSSFEDLLAESANAWDHKWSQSDIQIEGDVAAQQAIRYNIFQLNCTYTGEDARLNIGPKGFTGEKYGGSTYWDTEAYCLPFYLSTADPHVSRNLLIYRYKHLQKAIENAQLLGFKDGAALYPMVTMNGEECHNEWEITFEEIHRNGAIAYAIYDYINYTDDQDYMARYGLEVLIGIARFWAQRVNWSEPRQKYVILGVTGPNEFENNINNNWYTNRLAAWCLNYAARSCKEVSVGNSESWNRITEKTALDLTEPDSWVNIADKMYYPFDEDLGIYLQQDNFLDKEIKPVSELNERERPLVEHWSWDRILRSCYIKQADVLQGFYFFEDEFTKEELKLHFDFYEPITVHESSLSPCIHSVLASSLGNLDKAYEFYLRTSRLDLDDYNNDTCDGLHITSMAGTWLTITKGFAGMRVRNGELSFNPLIPANWKSYSFQIRFRGQILKVTVDHTGATKEILENFNSTSA